jgi:hypothetical protein
MIPPTEYYIGSVALLRVTFKDEDGNIADPTTNVTIIIIDQNDTEVVNITEAIGALSLIENPSTGVYQYRHTVVSGDPTRQEEWQYRFKCTSAAGEVVATGTIMAVDPSLYVDGQRFTLDDGINEPITFEFDDNAVVQAGNVIIDLTAAADADALAALIRATINGAGFNIRAALGSGPTIDLLNDVPGSHGNVLMTLTDSPPGTFLGMNGGRPPAPTSAGERRFHVRATDFPNP